MRCDTPVFFQRIIAGAYDTATGNYDADTITEEMRFASVTNTGDSTMNLVYGEIKQGSLTIRLLNHYEAPFDRIRVGDKQYRVDRARKLTTKHTFIVSEVQ